MNYSNPLQMLMQMGQQQQINPLQQLMINQQPQRFQPINHEQFLQGTSQLNDQALANLVTQARQQGISEEEIKSGLDFLLQLKK